MPEWKLQLPRNTRIRLEPSREYDSLRRKLEENVDIRNAVMEAIVKVGVSELKNHGIDINAAELSSINEVARAGGEVGIVWSTEGSSTSSTIWV